ncbi:hypothetical protein [Pedobacter gandavensis]|uniref:hypothetical protein n=1 Tax=Pedobacter gandavensis TaxID=2679963 RepID=UPI00292E1250|nr:hypothetical protein [Pedobacter gandavensis]
MTPQIKNNLDTLKELATKGTLLKAETRKFKSKSTTLKNDGLLNLLRNKKEATVFMTRLNTLIKNS